MVQNTQPFEPLGHVPQKSSMPARHAGLVGAVGRSEGALVGVEGFCVGSAVGMLVGTRLVGVEVGDKLVGSAVGRGVGATVIHGRGLGKWVGARVGVSVGVEVGAVGATVGEVVGFLVGAFVGRAEDGAAVGESVGRLDGNAVGANVSHSIVKPKLNTLSSISIRLRYPSQSLRCSSYSLFDSAAGTSQTSPFLLHRM